MAAAGGLFYANYQKRAGLLGLAGQYPGAEWRGMTFPGIGQAPPSWAYGGVGQEEGLGIIQNFPYMSRTAAGAGMLPGVVGAAGFLPGLGRMSASRRAAVIGQGMLFGLGGPGTMTGQFQNYASFLSRAMAQSQQRGVSPNLLQQVMNTNAAGFASTGGPISRGALYGLSGGFLNEMPGQQMQGAALSTQFNQGFRNAMGQSLQNPVRGYYMERLTIKATPGAKGGLARLLGPTSYAALQNSPVGQRLLAVYAGSYRHYGPHSPMTVNTLAQVLTFAQGTSAGLPGRVGKAIMPYTGVKSWAGQQMVGSWFLTGSGQGLASTLAYEGRTGTSLPGPGARAAALPYFGETGSPWAGFVAAGYNSNMAGQYRAGLAREGYKGPGGMGSALMQAGLATGMDPRVLGAILMQESSGGKFKSAAYGKNNVMGITSGTLISYMSSKGIHMTHQQAVAYLENPAMTKERFIELGSRILQWKGRGLMKTNPNATLADVLHSYGPQQGQGYGVQVAGMVGHALGMAGATQKAIESVVPYNQYGARLQAGLLGGSETLYGPGKTALTSVQYLGEAADATAGALDRLGKTFERWNKEFRGWLGFKNTPHQDPLSPNINR
jgi:hypothetical protein